MSGTSARDTAEATLRAARTMSVALLVVPLGCAAVAAFVGARNLAAWAVLPATLLGAVSPVIGYRLFHLRRDRLPAGADPSQRRRAFARAQVLALSVTEATALFGILVHLLSGRPAPLLGLPMHVLLTGALWPTRERLESFLEA